MSTEIKIPVVVGGWLEHCKSLRLSYEFATTKFEDGADGETLKLLMSWFDNPDNKELFKNAWEGSYIVDEKLDAELKFNYHAKELSSVIDLPESTIQRIKELKKRGKSIRSVMMDGAIHDDFVVRNYPVSETDEDDFFRKVAQFCLLCVGGDNENLTFLP